MPVARFVPLLLIPAVIFTAVWVARDLLRGRPFNAGHAAVGAATGLVFGVVQLVGKRRTTRKAAHCQEQPR
jgi:membrane associated rhomboid family serine protease